jgi:hypothetical protein
MNPKDTSPSFTVEDHPVEVLTVGCSTALVKTTDGSNIHVENAMGFVGYSDMGWVALDKLHPIKCRRSVSDFACLTCEELVEKRCISDERPAA